MGKSPKFEYKGEAYSLEKGKTYLLKVKSESLDPTGAEELLKWADRQGFKFVLVSVEEMDDIVIEEKKDTK